jgi:hypothetical protein
MDIAVNDKINTGSSNEAAKVKLDRETVKKALYSAINNAIDDERQRANQEIAEEMKNAIQQILEAKKHLIKKTVEDEKKLILQEVLETTHQEVFKIEALREKVAQAPPIEKSTIDTKSMVPPSTPKSHDNSTFEEKAELEILPPRDQKVIDKINDFLNSMPEAFKVELNTLVEKSVFKVKLREPVDFVEKLSSIPEILNVEKTTDNGQKKIRITLAAKAKWQKDQEHMNDKINEMFGIKG